MEHEDQVPKIPTFPTRPGSLFSFSFSDHRSVHRPSSALFNADGVSISEQRPPTSESYRRRFRRVPSVTRNGIMNRGRRSYFEHAAQKPSKSSNRRHSGLWRRDNGDTLSIGGYLGQVVYEPPRFDVEKRIREQESIPPRTAKGGEHLGDRAQSPGRRKVIVGVHVLLAAAFTGWWVSTLILHRKDMNWILPFLIWISVMIRLITFHVYSAWLMSPIYFIWDKISNACVENIPRKVQHPIGGVIVGAIIIIVSILSPDFEDHTRLNRAIGLLGYGFCILLLWATSGNKRMIDWHTTIVGIGMQFGLGLLALRTNAGFSVASWLSLITQQLLSNSSLGLRFVTEKSILSLPWFLIFILPSTVFLAGLAHVLAYWGMLSWLVRKSATFFWWSLRVSGVEAVVAMAAPFLGPGGAFFLIRPFIPYITTAELHQILCSGFSTIGGTLLLAYLDIGVDNRVLVSSSLMSIPTSLMVSKLRYPEEEEPFAVQYVTNSEMMRDDGASTVQAFANGLTYNVAGAWLGLKIAGIILAVFLGVIASIALLDGLLGWAGEYININPRLSLELIFSYLLYPISFLLGIPRNGDLLKVSQLLATKILKSEYTAYQTLLTNPAFSVEAMSARSRLIAQFVLCGFGNLGALAAQVGILTQMSQQRGSDIAKVAWSAWVSGVLSTLLTAGMAGVLVTSDLGVAKSV